MTRQNLLASIIERWLEEKPRRTISKLSQLTGVNYQVIKRCLQKENEPESENALALLNVCATLDETIFYFKDDPAISNFHKRIANSRKLFSSSQINEKLIHKNSCLITIMALTTGATHEAITELFGQVGLSEFNNLVDEGFLKESAGKPGIYLVDDELDIEQYIENLKTGAAVCRIIADLPGHEGSFNRFYAHNVDMETFAEIKKIKRQAHADIFELVKGKNGPYIVLSAMVATILNHKDLTQ